MAHAIIWSRRAAMDVAAIADYIALDSETYAAAMARRLLDAVLPLARFPIMGRRIPEFDDDNIREVIVGNYRIIYRIRTDSVQIAAIVHGARLLPNALGD